MKAIKRIKQIICITVISFYVDKNLNVNLNKAIAANSAIITQVNSDTVFIPHNTEKKLKYNFSYQKNKDIEIITVLNNKLIQKVATPRSFLVRIRGGQQQKISRLEMQINELIKDFLMLTHKIIKYIFMIIMELTDIVYKHLIEFLKSEKFYENEIKQKEVARQTVAREQRNLYFKNTFQAVVQWTKELLNGMYTEFFKEEPPTQPKEIGSKTAYFTKKYLNERKEQNNPEKQKVKPEVTLIKKAKDKPKLNFKFSLFGLKKTQEKQITLCSS
jgi:hypothetical protein